MCWILPNEAIDETEKILSPEDLLSTRDSERQRRVLVCRWTVGASVGDATRRTYDGDSTGTNVWRHVPLGKASELYSTVQREVAMTSRSARSG